MPRPPNLDNCIIYHIRELETRRVVYVGSTTNFTKRRYAHKSACSVVSHSNYHLPIYEHIRKTGGLHLYELIPVLYFTCTNAMELRIAEQREIDRHTGLFNACYAVRSSAQYRADNKDKIAEYKEQYQIENKDAIAARKSVKVTCECGCVIIKGGIAAHQKTSKHKKLLEQIDQANYEPFALLPIAYNV